VIQLEVRYPSLGHKQRLFNEGPDNTAAQIDVLKTKNISWLDKKRLTKKMIRTPMLSYMKPHRDNRPPNLPMKTIMRRNAEGQLVKD